MQVDDDRSCVVWLASTRRLSSAHVGVLDESENVRAGRFVRAADRARSLLASALVRLVAGDLLGQHPGEVRVRRECRTCGGPHGKVTVGHAVQLSVSHSGEAVVVAATRIAPLGIDIELFAGSAARAQRAARVACRADELAFVADDHDALRYWVRKEAIVKATGDGLAVPLGDVHVSAPDVAPELLGWRGRRPITCTLTDLDALDGYVGALAVLTDRPYAVAVRCADDLLVPC
jgi:4'-phosphopantetheinyl transferase